MACNYLLSCRSVLLITSHTHKVLFPGLVPQLIPIQYTTTLTTNPIAAPIS